MKYLRHAAKALRGNSTTGIVGTLACEYSLMMHALRGIWNLALLGAKTGFRLRGRYWTWRMETAFGADRSKWPSAAARRKAAIEYGAWVGEMRRMCRAPR